MEYYEPGSAKKEVQLLLGVSSIFSRGNLTGQQGLLILQAAEGLLRESRKTDKHGGMFGALATLYTDPELPTPLLERVLEVALQLNSTFYRENLANLIQQVVKFVDREEVDLSQPWRVMLGAVLQKKAQGKGQQARSLREVKGRWDEEEGDSTDHAS